jgi:Holliday junction resolvase RusA-like endonuclease
MIITLLGEPKSTQHIYGQSCRGGYAVKYMTEEGKSIKEAYQLQARLQYKGKLLTDDIPMITVGLFFSRKGKRDWDNFHKLSMDALTGIVWEDDSQVQTALVKKAFDKHNPRIEITIHE